MTEEKHSNFRKYGSAPIYDKLIFTDPQKEKEWEELDISTKKFIKDHLNDSCRRMENSMAIQTLAGCINDMNKDIQELKNIIREMQKENKKST